MAGLTIKAGGEALPEKTGLQVDGARLTGVLAALTRDVELEVTATAADGMTLEPQKRRIKVAADQPPSLRFIQPQEALAVIPTAEVPIQVEARDDFGVSLLGINFKIGDGPEETLYLGRLKDQPVTAALETLYLEKHSLDFKGAITYYAFAEDNYPPKAHRVVSDLRFIDILPFKQEYQFVEGEGSCCSSSVSLEELITRQRDDLNSAFALEREAAIDAAAAKRLARYESELHDATAEFAQGIAARAGPVPALEESVGAMQSATGRLEAKDVAGSAAARGGCLEGVDHGPAELAQASQAKLFEPVERLPEIRPPASSKDAPAAGEGRQARACGAGKRPAPTGPARAEFSEDVEPKGSGGPQLDPPAQAKQAAKSAPKPSHKSQSNRSKSGSSSGATTGQKSETEPSLAQQQQQAAEEAQRLDKLRKRTRRCLQRCAAGRARRLPPCLTPTVRWRPAARQRRPARPARQPGGWGRWRGRSGQ